MVSGRAPFALVAEHFGVAILPGTLVDSCIAYTFRMVLTSLTMERVSFLKGWAVRGFALGEQYQEQSPWLRASQSAVRELAQMPGAELTTPLPAYLAVGALAAGCALSFVVFW